MKKNNLVLYKNQPALITALQDDKFEITLEAGTKKVRSKDIVLLHSGECADLKAVLTAELPPVDFSEAAEFFSGETPLFSEIAELLWGSFTPEQSWKIWDSISHSPYFLCTSPDNPVSVCSKEEIEQRNRKQAEKDAAELLRNQFIVCVRECVQNKKVCTEIEKFSPFFQEIEAVALGTALNSKILKDLKIEQSPESAHTLLLKTGFWQIERNPYPTRYGCSLHSSKVELPEPVYGQAIYDLSSLPAYAIDNAWSTDPDDAVSFDGTYLWIHIANPADTIQNSSKADMDACCRGATLYAPEGTARMLGEHAVDYFALGLKENSYALSFKILLDETGAIQETDILRTRLRVQRLTYEQADSLKESPELAPLFAIAEHNRLRREQAGAVTITFPEVVIRLEESLGVKRVCIEPAVYTEAAGMIKEMMLLAGEAAARFAFKHSIPFQYISQETPDLPNKIPNGLAGEYKKRRAMRPRNVGTIPAMHAALGIAMYGQVTSPLRRYGDLVSHRQLLYFIDKKPLLSASDLLVKIAAGDTAARACVQAERFSRQHWTLVYLLQNPHWTGTAIVLDIQGKKAHIFIRELAYESDITLQAGAALNDEITVQVQSVQLAYLQVHFVAID